MSEVVSKVSDLLDLHPPPHGGIDISSPIENADKNHLSALGYVLCGIATFVRAHN